MSEHSDDGANLLSESTYEILSESNLVMTDDDDDEGSSVNSFDDDSVEDLANMEDADSLHDFTSEIRDHPGIPSFGGLDEFHMESSANTLREEPVSVDSIIFEEPPYKNGFISVMHALHEYSTEEAPKILASIRCEGISDRLSCTVRQTMCQELLCLDEPFRFLYVGAPSAKEEIFNKLGAALALPIVECSSSTISTDSKSSRFNVVPVTSFGMKSTPEVELIESFGVEMSLDVCTQAGRTRAGASPDTLSLCLNGNQWVRSVHGDSGFRLEAPGWKLPHLVVVFCSEKDTLEEKLTQIFTKAFAGRHSLPSLLISQKQLHKPTENYTIDHRSIHLCLESRSSKSGETIVHKRLPVDLATFTSLDVRQMNRNLACVTGLVKPDVDNLLPNGDDEPTSDSTSLLRDVEKRPHSVHGLASSISWVRNNKSRDILMLMAVSWLFICGIVGGLFATAYVKFSRNAGSIPVNATLDGVPMVSTPTAVFSTMTNTGIYSSISTGITKPSPVASKISTSCSYPVGLARSLLLEPTPLAGNDSQEFKVKILENNIILRPPQQYSAARKPPPMFIQVTRNGEQIESELSQLFEGVYTIVIPRDEAWGSMNISVQTKSKPLFKESFELDFGRSWLSWMKVAKKQQQDVIKMAEQASSEGKRIAREIGQKTTEMRDRTQKLLREKANTISENVSGKLSKLYENSAVFRPEHFMPKYGAYDYIKMAQRQAKNVWSKAEFRKGDTAACGSSEGCGNKR